MDLRFPELKHIISFLVVWSIAVSQINANNKPYDHIKNCIITSETIRSAGLQRLGDILLLINNWNTYTIDGFTYYASANCLSTYQRQSWIVMLDRQRMDINVFDTKNLNTLPVSLNQIDYVEIISVPQIHEGEFTERGLIHFHSKKPLSGLSFQGDFSIGNEIGDPGPYRDTEFATPNIDKIGPDYSLNASFCSKHFYTTANFLFHQHFATNSHIVQRNKSIAGGYYPKLEIIEPSFKVGLSNKKSNLELFISHSSFKDFLFFKPYGREIPVNNSFSHAGGRGSIFVGDKSDIHYQLKHSISRLDKRANALDIDFNWRMNNIYANIEIDRRNKSYRTKFGGGFERFWMTAGYPHENSSLQIGKLYAEVDFDLFYNMHQNISGMTVYSNGEIAIKSLLTNVWKISSKESLESILSFSQRLFEEDNSLWFWSENGYRILREMGTSYDILGKIKKSNKLLRGA